MVAGYSDPALLFQKSRDEMECHVVVIAPTMLVPAAHLAPANETHYNAPCANKGKKPGGCAGSLPLRTKVPDASEKNAHDITDFLRDIRPVFSSYGSPYRCDVSIG